MLQFFIDLKLGSMYKLNILYDFYSEFLCCVITKNKYTLVWPEENYMYFKASCVILSLFNTTQYCVTFLQ